MKGRQISPSEAVVAVVALIGATTATILGEISSDALVGMYGTVLGYVFGRVRNGIEYKAEQRVIQSPKTHGHSVRGTEASESLTVTHPRQDDSEPEHTVPGTRPEK